MHIQPNQNTGGLSPAGMNRVEFRRSEIVNRAVNFEATDAVRKALRDTPDVRPEVVEAARQMIGQPTYPPRETINKLSQLLAMRLSGD
jgi:hypothetical protein